LADKRTEGAPNPRRPREPSRLGLVPPARAGARTPQPRKEAEARPRAPRAPRPRPQRPRFRLTRRATILALALCAVVVTIAYPLQQYLSESSQLDAVNQQNATLSRQVAQLQRQVALWGDPGYVRIQARSELHYVAPGEEGFTIPGPANGTEPLGLPTPAASPWYDNLWNTVKSPSAAPDGG
jgi:cell division protein FtsB